MTGKKNIMNTIKRAVSPRLHRATASTASMPGVSSTPLTDFICSRLQGDNLKLFGLMFAEAVKNDRHAKVIRFENVYKFLGHDRYDNAVRQLRKAFKDSELVKNNLLTSEEVTKNVPGPSKTSYLVSVRQFETLMLNAQTAEGAIAREMMLDVKDAVQDYIKWEMEAASRAAMEREKLVQQQLEEQMSRLALKDKELEAFSAQKEQLEAALVAERERRAALSALRTAEDAPQQIAYLMQSGTHSTYVKIGKTVEDAEKRKKELQTGNPEEITVLFEKKCVDSRLIEKNLHHIFRWYKRRGEWYEIDKQQAIFATQLMSHLLDGLRKVEYESSDIVEQCQELFGEQGLKLNPESLTLNDVEECEPAVSIVEESNPYIKYADAKLEVTCNNQHRLVQNEVETACKEWMKLEFRLTTFNKKSLWKVLEDKGAIRKITRIADRTPQGFWGVRFKDDTGKLVDDE